MFRYAFLALCSTILFLYGFFPLTYNSVSFNNEPPTKIGQHTYNFKELYSVSPFENVVLVVVDALRLDFTTKKLMPKLASLMEETGGCSNTIKVESPTVTLPRIKALMTGSVPQFIDVVVNLMTDKILEDSLIHSAADYNRKIVFYGDDTWLKLFPKQFLRSEGTSSFFVRDFYQVDDNVTRNVKIELEIPNDWDIMILHYLGLDHIGHVFGPNSKLVPKKLQEMDDIIFKIYNSLSSKFNRKTLLLITGDHGMRDSGGHGGTTYPESHVPLILIGASCKQHFFAQTDIAANLAILLRVKIPSSSIGLLHRSLLDELTTEEYLFALKYNAHLLASKTNSNFDYLHLAGEFHERFLKNNDSSSALKAMELYEKSSLSMNEKLFRAFVRQNLHAMLVAMLVLLICLLALLKMLFSPCKSNSDFGFLVGALLSQVFIDSVVVFVIVFLVLIFLLARNVSNLRIFFPKFKNSMVLLLTFVHPIAFLSSSFVDEEHQLWYHFLMTLFVICLTKRSSLDFIILALAFRFLRTINQTGDKWISLPDFSDWLLLEDNNFYYKVFFIIGLTMTLLANSLLFLVSIQEMLYNSLFLIAIYFYKESPTFNSSFGRFLWLAIIVHFLFFGRKRLIKTFLLLYCLLLKPYNVIILPYLIFASYIFRKNIRSTNLNTLCHVWLGSALYFLQGHSNSLATIDVAVGYIGLETYIPIWVGLIIMLHTFTFPILIYFLLFEGQKKEKHLETWLILLTQRFYVMLMTSFTTFVQRYHIFIWSVFAPKIFIEFAYTCLLFLAFLLYVILNFVIENIKLVF